MCLHGQEWQNKSNKTFQEIRKDYYANQSKSIKKKESKTVERNHKQFKRWEQFWNSRLDENGSIPSELAISSADLLSQPEFNFRNGTNTPKWDFIGPESKDAVNGIGRINRVIFNPLNSSEMWACSPSGGLWKSIDDGNNWVGLAQNLASIGVSDLAIDPKNTKIMYMATGDADATDAYSIGIVKTTDGGVTWKSTGLTHTVPELRYTSRILISPNNSNILIASTGLSHRYYGTEQGGIYKSTDAGVTWTLKSIETNIRDLHAHPTNFNILLAGSNDGKVYRSTDAGENWSLITTGLPSFNGDRVALAFSSSDPNYVYAIINKDAQTQEGFYQSKDAGLTWQVKNTTTDLGDGQQWYDLAIDVDPKNKNRIFAAGVQLYESVDEGVTWRSMQNDLGTDELHSDFHGLKFHPTKQNLLIASNDGGVAELDVDKIIVDNSFGDPFVTIDCQNKYKGLHATQFYRIGILHKGGDHIIAGAQDNEGFYRSNGSWKKVVSGYDGMNGAVDQQDQNYLYASSQSGRILMSKQGFSDAGFEIKPTNAVGEPWVTPFILDPKNGNTMVVGYSNLLKNTNTRSLTGKTNWTDITPTGHNKSESEFTFLTFSAGNSNVLCAATHNMNAENGEAYYSSNVGSTWNKITPTGFAQGQYVKAIAINPTNDSELYAVVTGYVDGAKVFKSTNTGASWTNISSNLPNIAMRCIAYETGSKDRIFIGTDAGMYMKDENTDQWVKYGTDLPNVIVNDIEIQYTDSKVIAGTYGRGLWSVSLPKPVVTSTSNVDQGKMKVYPNPAQNSINLELTELSKVEQIVIYNELGIVYKIIKNPSTIVTRVNTDDFPSGHYYISLISENGKSSATTFIINK